MSMKTPLWSLWFGFIFLVSAGTVWSDDTGSRMQGARSRWSIGDSWRVSVEMYSMNWMASYSSPARQAEVEVPSLMGAFTMEIRVVGATKWSNSILWQIAFIPDKDAPKFMRTQSERVWISEDDLRVRKVQHTDGGVAGELALQNFDDVTLVSSRSGFPVQLVPALGLEQSLPEKKRNHQRLSVENHALGTDRVIELTVDTELRNGSWQRNKRVVQRWIPGKKWWSTYEEYLEGHIVTRLDC